MSAGHGSIIAWTWRWYQRGSCCGTIGRVHDRWRVECSVCASCTARGNQRRSVAAGVHIHLRTTSSVMYHRLSDANFSDCFLVYQCILHIYCIYCIHLCKNINVCSRAHFILYLFIHFIYTGVRGKSDLCKIKIQHIALEFRQDMEFLIILRWCILKSARMKILHCCRKR